jgi:transcriptional regulator with XRE-family HTH domain
MRQPAAGSRDARSQGSASRGHDPQIAHFFRNMRTATRLSRDAIARRLATTPATIEDLELGAVSALPRWPETVRIVRGYCELLRLDPEPLLWRIQQLLHAGNDPPPSRPVGPPPPALRKERPRAAAPRRRRRGFRKLMILSMPPVVVAGLLYLATTAPAPFYRLLALLPRSAAAPARAVLDALVLYSAPRRDGLRWIDIGDPRLRKVDKLPAKRR